MPKSNLAEESGSKADGRVARRLDNAERLFDAAMRLTQRSGYSAITADDICREAGVGRATFFRIYKSKAGLLREFNRRLGLQVEDRVRQSELGSIDKLYLVANEIAISWERSGAFFGAVVSEYVNAPVEGISHSIHQEIYDLLIDIVAEGMKGGALRASFTPNQLASLLLYQIGSSLTEAGLAGEKEFQSLAKKVVEYFLNGAAK